MSYSGIFKRTGIILLMVFCITLLTACGNSEEKSDYALSYVEGKVMSIPFNDTSLDCVGIFTEYTNNSGESVLPADTVSVKAYQNGTELSPWVFTGQKTEGYIQCDANVQAGITAEVIWIFEREDDSPVSVEFSDGQQFMVE